MATCSDSPGSRENRDAHETLNPHRVAIALASLCRCSAAGAEIVIIEIPDAVNVYPVAMYDKARSPASAIARVAAAMHSSGSYMARL